MLRPPPVTKNDVTNRHTSGKGNLNIHGKWNKTRLPLMMLPYTSSDVPNVNAVRVLSISIRTASLAKKGINGWSI